MAMLGRRDSRRDESGSDIDWMASDGGRSEDAVSTASSSSRLLTSFKWQPKSAEQETRVKERIRQKVLSQTSNTAVKLKLMAIRSRRRVQLAIERKRAFNAKERALVLELAINMIDLNMRVSDQADWAQELFSAARTIQRAYRSRLARREQPALQGLIDPEADRPLLVGVGDWDGWKVKYDKWKPESEQLRRLRTMYTGIWEDYDSATDTEFTDSEVYSDDDSDDQYSDEERDENLALHGLGRLRSRRKRRLGAKVHQSIVKAYRAAGLGEQLRALVLDRRGSDNLTRRTRPGTTATAISRKPSVLRPSTQQQDAKRPATTTTHALKPMTFGNAPTKPKTMELATLARSKSRGFQRTKTSNMQRKLSTSTSTSSAAAAAAAGAEGLQRTRTGLSAVSFGPTADSDLSELSAIQRTESVTSVLSGDRTLSVSGGGAIVPEASPSGLDQQGGGTRTLLVEPPGKLARRLSNKSDDWEAAVRGLGPGLPTPGRPGCTSVASSCDSHPQDVQATNAISSNNLSELDRSTGRRGGGVPPHITMDGGPADGSTFTVQEDGRGSLQVVHTLDSGDMGDIDWHGPGCVLSEQANRTSLDGRGTAAAGGDIDVRSAEYRLQPAARRVVMAQRFLRRAAAAAVGAACGRSGPGSSVPAYVVLAPQEAPTAAPQGTTVEEQEGRGHQRGREEGKRAYGVSGYPEQSLPSLQAARELPRHTLLSPVPEWGPSAVTPPASRSIGNGGGGPGSVMDLINEASENILSYVTGQLADLEASHRLGSPGSQSSAVDLHRPRLMTVKQSSGSVTTEGSLKHLTKRIMMARRFTNAAALAASSTATSLDERPHHHIDGFQKPVAEQFAEPCHHQQTPNYVLDHQAGYDGAEESGNSSSLTRLPAIASSSGSPRLPASPHRISSPHLSFGRADGVSSGMGGKPQRWSQPSRLPPAAGRIVDSSSGSGSSRRFSDSAAGTPSWPASPQAFQHQRGATRHSGPLAALPASTFVKKNRSMLRGGIYDDPLLRSALPPAAMAQMRREASRPPLPAVARSTPQQSSASFSGGFPSNDRKPSCPRSPLPRLHHEVDGPAAGLAQARADSAYDLTSQFRQTMPAAGEYCGHQQQAFAAELMEKRSLDLLGFLPASRQRGQQPLPGAFHSHGSSQRSTADETSFDVSGFPAPWTPLRSRQNSRT